MRVGWGWGCGGAVLAAALAPALYAAGGPGGTGQVDYDRDIRPIFAEACFACHGFDEATRKAGLRLDTAAGAGAKLPSGAQAVVPGHARQGTLVARLRSGSMPPASTKKKLSAAQIDLIARWVEQGAEYRDHWAFEPVRRPDVPAVRRTNWVRNPIDAFVLARLEREGLPPSREADRETLARRVAFDLTGLPPRPADVGVYLADRRPGAYERMVDRMLASPHYGERMALMWLDLARYADTHGYHIDSHRDMWRWRDWVIDAFNKNQPFDQFTVEQLAGDLLPNPTLDQRIATGFNRNHPINFEGGAIPEEYHANYIFDRIDTTATTWMGLTLRCTQCHNHKYEPFSQREFYQLYSYFNNVPERGLDGQQGNAVPFIKAPTAEQTARLAEFDRALAALRGRADARAAEMAGAQARWESTALGSALAAPSLDEGLEARVSPGESLPEGREWRGGTPAVVEGKLGAAARLAGSSYLDLGPAVRFDRTSRFSFGAWVRPAGREPMAILSRMDDAAAFRGWDLYLGDGRVFVHLIHQWEGNAIRVNTKAAPIQPDQWRHVFATYDGSGKAAGVRIYVDGKPQELVRTHDSLTGSILVEGPVHVGRRNPGAPYRGLVEDVRIYGRELTSTEVDALHGLAGVRSALETPPSRRSETHRKALQAFFLENHDPPYAALRREILSVEKQRSELDAAIPTTMVMEEMPAPRETHVLVRGQYDKKAEKVSPGTPAILPPLPADAPKNRLGFARWLVSPEHPLTSRVAANRFWMLCFGHGIVRTPENFGLQGERPSHPELLDWLASEFVRTGWDVKGLMRTIVTSATYRQDSRATSGLRERDPDNLLLARGPRFRLQAEFVRDQALQLAGLLVPRLGGPSVRPYHPAGLWEELAFGGNFTAQTYVQDHGEALYRRSMYTFWKRTCPPPSLQTFDAPEREFCVVKRIPTNTPLQALVLMNDPTYVEAARRFAERILTETAAAPRDRVGWALRQVLVRGPRPSETSALTRLYEERLGHYRAHPEAAEKLLAVGEWPRNKALPPAEVAAWTSVCSALFNLDEAMTRN